MCILNSAHALLSRRAPTQNPRTLAWVFCDAEVLSLRSSAQPRDHIRKNKGFPPRPRERSPECTTLLDLLPYSSGDPGACVTGPAKEGVGRL